MSMGMIPIMVGVHRTGQAELKDSRIKGRQNNAEPCQAQTFCAWIVDNKKGTLVGARKEKELVH
jgi:hypothetical protein